MRIYVLALEGVFDTGLSALLDVISIAQELTSIETAADRDAIRFELQLVGVRRKVSTAQGLRVPLHLISDLPAPDSVLVPALGSKMPAALIQNLARRDIQDAVECLQNWTAAGVQVGAACTSTFVLAESGMLDGRCATTSWWLSALFRNRYPDVELDERRMLVTAGDIVTAGAALAHLDLALNVIRQSSPTLAAMCARYLLVEARSSQAAFVIPNHIAHTDPIVEQFERWARAHLAEGFSSHAAAHAIGTSERTLERRLQTVLGKSPLAYFQDLRVERAVHLLQTTADNIERIAAMVGYADGTTLRTLLRKKLGKGVRELRKQVL